MASGSQARTEFAESPSTVSPELSTCFSAREDTDPLGTFPAPVTAATLGFPRRGCSRLSSFRTGGGRRSGSRAWDAWLAAEGRDRAVRYSAFAAALADEERAAAEVKRMIELPQAAEYVATPDPGRSGQGTR